MDINKYIDLEKSSYGSIAEIWPLDYNNAEIIDEIYKSLQALKNNPKISGVYLKQDIPARFQIRNHKRTAPILLTASEGVQIVVDPEKAKQFAYYHGNHGFDPEEVPSMRGIFLAHGNSFKSSYYSKKPVKLIDIYSLICSLLKVEPLPHDGNFNRINHFLTESFLNSNNLKYNKYEL